jgi:hypothetical protein
MFKIVSFEEAVRLFKEWGFQVEPGPRPGEVTLIIEAPDYRCCTVYDAGMLPQIATVALEVRWQNGSMVASLSLGPGILASLRVGPGVARIGCYA